jgi:hypothetical protein
MSAAADSSPDTAAGFSPKVVLALLMAAIFAAGAYGVLSAYAPELRTGQGGDNALSSSATGYAGVVRLMGYLGHPVAINRDRQRLRAYPGLMVLTPEGPLTPAQLRPSHPRLVVLPKWVSLPDPNHPGWVAIAGPVRPAQAASIIPHEVGTFTVSRRTGSARPVTLQSSGPAWPRGDVVTGPVTQLQTASGASLWPVITEPDGGIVVGLMPDGHTYVLTDPDLLNTQGLRDSGTAQAAVTLLTALSGQGPPAVFDVTLNGIEQNDRNILKLAIEPPFLGATLCLLAAAALVGLQGWNRFGPAQRPQRAVALGKTALAENGAGMVRLARREPRMALRYVRLCRQRAAAALGAEHLEPAALDDFLDRWAERVGAQDRISALAAEAAQVKKLSDLAPLARKTRRWRLEMTREPG